MKLFLLSLFTMVSCTSFSQVLNGSFENGTGADLSNWEWTCGAISSNSAPNGGGNWCIEVNGGNLQGCFPGYAYQKIPSITSGQTFVLSGWAYAQISDPIGIFFGKINNGNISIYAGDTTSSNSWTYLTKQAGYALLTGDTAIVILFGGLTTGPVQGYGYFDLINLTPVTGIDPLGQAQSINIFPNPVSSELNLRSERLFKDATLLVYNSYGQVIKQIDKISGQTITLQRNNLPEGMYFLQITEDNKIIATEKIIISGQMW